MSTGNCSSTLSEDRKRVASHEAFRLFGKNSSKFECPHLIHLNRDWYRNCCSFQFFVDNLHVVLYLVSRHAPNWSKQNLFEGTISDFPFSTQAANAPEERLLK